MSRRTKRGVMHKFYFIKPRYNANAAEFAERLIELEHVDGVYLTEGNYGFIVRVRFSDENRPKNVTDYISKNVSRKYGELTSYFEYRKGRG
jgi:DNA-binding Lrp family transcriptional regulator